jgi:hypothetical protein
VACRPVARQRPRIHMAIYKNASTTILFFFLYISTPISEEMRAGGRKGGDRETVPPRPSGKGTPERG